MVHIPKSATKWVLLNALGLDWEHQVHRDLYIRMKSEAIRVYSTQLHISSALRPECRHKPPPWSNNDFTDAAFHDAVATIYKRASPETSPLYRHGRPGGDNWVVKWFLYHVCRYRDHRNKGKAQSTRFEDDDEFFGPKPPSPQNPAASSSKSSKSSEPTGRFYDPARDTYER